MYTFSCNEWSAFFSPTKYVWRSTMSLAVMQWPALSVRWRSLPPLRFAVNRACERPVYTCIFFI